MRSIAGLNSRITDDPDYSDEIRLIHTSDWTLNLKENSDLSSDYSEDAMQPHLAEANILNLKWIKTFKSLPFPARSFIITLILIASLVVIIRAIISPATQKIVILISIDGISNLN